MIAGILAVGTELLMGQTVNTNATYLSQELNKLGISVYYHFTVGDNKDRGITMLKYLLEECDIVFTTGGLGPTQDDITKEIVGELLNLKMLLDEHSKEMIEERFKMYNMDMVGSNIRQAYFPEGALILDNSEGTAPACIVDVPDRDKKIFVLPGPPREMKHIFETHMKNYLKDLNDINMYSKYLSVYNLGESSTEESIIDLINAQSDPTIATYAADSKVLIRVTSFNKNDTIARQNVDETIVKIKERIDPYIVSDDGEDINQVIVNLLRKKNLTISLAESCTGGKLVESLVSISGASEVVDRGIVTYSNEAKKDELNVKEETLAKYGAVSHEVCHEMVEGLVKRTHTDVGISITGIAGPSGGSLEKPVGLVFIGIYYAGQVVTIEHNFNGTRAMIQNRALNSALKLIYDTIK